MKIKQLEATLQDTIRSKDSVIKDLRSELNEVCADLKGVRMDLKGIRMKLDDVGMNCTCDAYRKAMEKREETEGRPTSADGIQTCSSTTVNLYIHLLTKEARSSLLYLFSSNKN